MIITRKSTFFISAFPILSLNNTPIELVSSYKYLGVTLSSNLSWTPHIKSVCAKSKKIIGLIYHSLYRYSSSFTLLKLYKALVLPHLTYCSSVWAPHPSSLNARTLEKLNTSLSKFVSASGPPTFLSSLLPSATIPFNKT